MMRADRLLAWVLRLSGVMMLAALAAVFMPRAWMAYCHERLGFGAFPEAPIAEYLARLTSGLYALLGGLFLVVASDVRRHARVIVYLAVAVFAVAVGMLALTPAMGMPLWWSAADTASAVAMAVAVLVLQAMVRRQDRAAQASE
jgi:uncharacterized membrane protein